MKKLSLVVAIIASCAFFAQDIQAQQANRQARRGTNQMGQMRMGQGQQLGQMGAQRMMNSEQRAQMLARSLRLSQEQQDKIVALFDEQREAMAALGAGPARQEGMRKLMEEQDAKIKAILTEEQYATYNSPDFRGRMMGQMGPQGPAPLTIDQQVERVAAELKLTEKQQKELKECLEARAKENEEFRTSSRNMTAIERREAQQKLRTEQQDKIKKILGEENFAKFQEMGVRFGQMQQAPGMQMTPERQVEALSRTLELSNTQKTQLTKFFEERNREMQGMRERSMNLLAEERRELMQKSQAEQEAKLKEILGEENFTKYQEQMRRQMRAPGMGAGPGPGSGPGFGTQFNRVSPPERGERPGAGERPQRRTAPQR